MCIVAFDPAEMELGRVALGGQVSVTFWSSAGGFDPRKHRREMSRRGYVERAVVVGDAGYIRVSAPLTRHPDRLAWAQRTLYPGHFFGSVFHAKRKKIAAAVTQKTMMRL